MKNVTITAAGAPAAVGPYCHAKLCGNTLYCSGQLGLDPATGALAEGVEAQAVQALDNLGAVLRAAGMDYCDVAKTTVFLSDMGNFAAVNEITPGTSTASPLPAPASRRCCPRAAWWKWRPLRSNKAKPPGEAGGLDL